MGHRQGRLCWYLESRILSGSAACHRASVAVWASLLLFPSPGLLICKVRSLSRVSEVVSCPGVSLICGGLRCRRKRPPGTEAKRRASPRRRVSRRNTVLSLCLENAELKEQMGEAMSDGWELEEDREKGEPALARAGRDDRSLQAELRKLQGKLKNARSVIGLLKEQLALSSQEGRGQLGPRLLVRLAGEVDGASTEPGCSPGPHQPRGEEEATAGPRPGPQGLGLAGALAADAHQVSVGSDGGTGPGRGAGVPALTLGRGVPREVTFRTRAALTKALPPLPHKYSFVTVS